MKKRIYWSLCGMSILMALLMAALSMWSFYSLLLRQAREELSVEFKIIEKAAADLTDRDAEPDEWVALLDKQFYKTRMTLVDEEGHVIYDSTGANEMGNHGMRPEIISAFVNGHGEAIRKSETMGEVTFYYAGKLDDTHVLRISKQARSVGMVFAGMIPGMLGILLLILAGSLLLASRLTKRIVEPLEKLDPEGGGIEGYEEFNPFLNKIQEQGGLIKEQIERLREERDRIATITSNMREGLILLDLDRSILSVNRGALVLLDAPDGDYEGRGVLALTRSLELADCVDQALRGGAATTVLEEDGRFCQAFVNPVRNQGKLCGAIVLLLDVTEKQRAEKIRRDFSANVSHELKTPLTSISGFAEMIENGMVSNLKDIKKFAGRIYSEASRLITLTDDIIRLSRIEEEGPIERVPVELKELCEKVAETIQYSAIQKQVVLTVAGEPAEILGDRRMLEELAGNLIENAVKYNWPGGRVDVDIRSENGWATLMVSDTGIGIPKEHQERVFERFYRVDKSRSKQTGGTGLGLSIVKHVVDQHGGKLGLVSAQDEGTTITVRFPE